MSKKVKSANKITLPIIPNQPVKLVLDNGTAAQTFPESIDSILYKDGTMYVTITTGSSIYQDIPIPVRPFEHYQDGQLLRAGEVIQTLDRTTTISTIEQILEDKIIIRNEEGETFATPIFLC